MSKFLYPHLSEGYLLSSSAKATLNSLYFQEVFKKEYNFNDILPFPQRIPKLDFFKELCRFEKNNFKRDFNKLIENINYSITEAIHKNEFRASINYGNLICRLGVYDIFNIDPIKTKKIDQSDLIEFQLINITAQANKDISSGNAINLKELYSFIKIIYITKEISVSNRVAILVGSRYIVYAYRFSKDPFHREISIKIYPALLNLVDSSSNIFIEKLYQSIVYRGVAMITELGFEKQNELLRSAEEIAISITPKNSLEIIVYKENLFTLFQTLSKWHKKEESLVEEYLQKMIALDNYDSTGYSEYAIFLFENGFYEKAVHLFKKAYDLGSPGIAMNFYFYVKCLEKQNPEKKLLRMYTQSTKLDETALNPWLDIVNYYKIHKYNKKLKQTVQYIFDNSDLSSQLTLEEYNQLSIFME